MADATPASAVNDSVSVYDVAELLIKPLVSQVFYRLRITWTSGRVEFREGLVSASDFTSCLAAFAQATPKKKFLNFLVSNGYESNLTVS